MGTDSIKKVGQEVVVKGHFNELIDALLGILSPRDPVSGVAKNLAGDIGDSTRLWSNIYSKILTLSQGEIDSRLIEINPTDDLGLRIGYNNQDILTLKADMITEFGKDTYSSKSRKVIRVDARKEKRLLLYGIGGGGKDKNESAGFGALALNFKALNPCYILIRPGEPLQASDIPERDTEDFVTYDLASEDVEFIIDDFKEIPDEVTTSANEASLNLAFRLTATLLSRTDWAKEKTVSSSGRKTIVLRSDEESLDTSSLFIEIDSTSASGERTFTRYPLSDYNPSTILDSERSDPNVGDYNLYARGYVNRVDVRNSVDYFTRDVATDVLKKGDKVRVVKRTNESVLKEVVERYETFIKHATNVWIISEEAIYPEDKLQSSMGLHALSESLEVSDFLDKFGLSSDNFIDDIEPLPSFRVKEYIHVAFVGANQPKINQSSIKTVLDSLVFGALPPEYFVTDPDASLSTPFSRQVKISTSDTDFLTGLNDAGYFQHLVVDNLIKDQDSQDGGYFSRGIVVMKVL